MCTKLSFSASWTLGRLWVELFWSVYSELTCIEPIMLNFFPSNALSSQLRSQTGYEVWSWGQLCISDTDQKQFFFI